MFTVEMLPAQRGDCLWITYGEERPRHVLVDAGPREVSDELVPELRRRIADAGGDDSIELLVISHVDADHIDGVVRLLTREGMLAAFRDVWFNAYRHLPNALLGPAAGEILTAQLSDSKRWNLAFGGEHHRVVAPCEPIVLDGGLRLTLLSPTLTQLEKLAPFWKDECAKAGLVAGEGAEPPASFERFLGSEPVEDLVKKAFTQDRREPNGSSIAFIAEYGGKSVLLGADAHPDVLAASLVLLGPVPRHVDAVKVPHHGSRKNLSPALLDVLTSPLWLFSTSGSNYNHPDDECVARVVTTQPGATLAFNYRAPGLNERWETDPSMATYGYTTDYPAEGTQGLVITL